MRTRSKKTKNNKIKLVADVWARVCDILLDRQQDRTLAKLSQTSREIHNLVAPKLYGIVRLRNYKALCLVLEDGQTLIQHVEIDCEPDLHNFVDSKKPSYPILTTVTCFIKTRCSMADDWEEDFGAFVDWVLRMLPTKHLRWHHTYADDEHTDLVPKLKTQFKLGGQYESIELPPAWQDKLYWNNNALTALVLDAKPLGNCRPSYWYTDPSDADDEAGHIYKKLIDELRDTGSVKNKPMYTVKIARSNETPTTQPGVFDYGTWETEKLDTRSCAILTDLAIMHKMGLANTKIVSIPDEWEPEEWRKWILGEGLVPGNGVLADLKAIEERLKPGGQRRPYEESRSHTYVKDLITTTDRYYVIAARTHGLEGNAWKKRKIEVLDEEEACNMAVA